MVRPANGAANASRNGRIGMTFSDHLDMGTVDGNVLVREKGGAVVPGLWSGNKGIINFTPDNNLASNTEYEIVVLAGGLTDGVGNAVSSQWISSFQTGSGGVNEEPVVVSGPSADAEVGMTGTQVSFDIEVTDTEGDTLFYEWIFGDGTSSSEKSPAKTYDEPGNYRVEVLISDGKNQVTAATYFTVHRPLTPGATRSSTIINHAASDRVWVVNRDNASVTAIGDTNAKWKEISVGQTPTSLAATDNGEIWVTCRDDDRIDRIDALSGDFIAGIQLPYGTRPIAIAADPAASRMWVSCQGSGRLIAIDESSHNISKDWSVGKDPGALTLSADGAYVYVARFVSDNDAQGTITRVTTSNGTKTAVSLAFDQNSDTEDNGRGLPNYVHSLAVSPDSHRVWYTAKKDNIQRGLKRDGLELTHEFTNRTYVGKNSLVRIRKTRRAHGPE